MAIVKYRIAPGFALIQRVEVVKETAGAVWLPGFRIGGGTPPLIRELKKSSHSEYLDSWELAHRRITEIADEALTDARRRLQLAQAHAGNVKGMKKPEGA